MFYFCSVFPPRTRPLSWGPSLGLQRTPGWAGPHPSTGRGRSEFLWDSLLQRCRRGPSGGPKCPPLQDVPLLCPVELRLMRAPANIIQMHGGQRLQHSIAYSHKHKILLFVFLRLVLVLLFLLNALTLLLGSRCFETTPRLLALKLGVRQSCGH